MILDDEDILIKDASNSCKDPIKLLFDCYDDESSSLNLLNRYMNIEGFKWEQSGAYYILVNNKNLIYCQILKDSGAGSMNITTYAFNEECRNKLHYIFTTLGMIYFKIEEPSKGYYVSYEQPPKGYYIRYDLHDRCYNPSYLDQIKRIIV